MSAARPGRRGTVVLLHGLNRTQLSMAPLAWRLRRAGYATSNLYYPSARATIEEHADRLLARLASELPAAEGPLHFVGHSLGCLVVRCALHRGLREPLASRAGRFVMLGPPNRGSALARRFAGQRFWDRWYGTASFHQLARPEVLSQWVPAIPFGVIAAGRLAERGWNPLLPGDDDGIVEVTSTHLEGEADHLLLRGVHTTLPWRRDVAEQVLRFLETGRFESSATLGS